MATPKFIDRSESMGKVVLHASMSLDGFIAGLEDEMDWVFQSGGPDALVRTVIETTGAVVLGRRTFNVSLKQDQLPYGGEVKAPQFVVTHTRRDPEVIGGLEFTFVTEGIERAVELAKTAAGDKNVSLLGASIDQQCLRLGLVDEIVIHLLPILLGQGIRLFDHFGPQSIELVRTQAVSSHASTSLRFQVI
jgi:dihydrofolate reductase